MKYLVLILLALLGSTNAITWHCCASKTIQCASCLTVCALCDAATPAGAAVCAAATIGCAASCAECVSYNAMDRMEFNASRPVIISPFVTEVRSPNKTGTAGLETELVVEPVFNPSDKYQHFYDIINNDAKNSSLGDCRYGASNYCMTPEQCQAGCAQYYGTSKWCLYNSKTGPHKSGCCQCDTNCKRCSSWYCPCNFGCDCT